MRDSDTGNVTCQMCGAYLGNYLTGDYYSLIRLKFCPACKALADRQRKAFWAENDALRKQIIEERCKV